MSSANRTSCGSNFVVGIVKSALGLQYEIQDGKVINLRGFERNVLNALASTLNFSYTVVDRTSSPYGSRTENGTWTGIIGEVIKGDLDFAMATLTATPERMDVVDFSPPYLVDQLAFFVRAAKLQFYKGVFYQEPFTNTVWLATFISLLVYGVLLHVLLDQKYNGNGRAVIYISANLINQGYKINPTSGRTHRRPVAILLSFWLFASSVLYIHYGSSLTASASVSNAMVIDTLDELVPYLESGDLKIGVLDGSNYFDYVMNRATSLLNGDLFHNAVRVFQDKDFVDVFMDGKIAFLVAARYFVMEMHHKQYGNQYHQLKEVLCNENIAIALNKNFPCTKEFGKVMTIMRESGCLDKWENDMMFEYTKREAENELYSFTSINGREFDRAFWLCFGGNFVAFLVFNVERAVVLYRNRDKDKK